MNHFSDVLEFEWDRGNIGKNKRHHVEDLESEESFLDMNKIIYKDVLHSKNEERFILLGKTKQERLLYIVFTRRQNKIRIISARDMDRKEGQLYEKET